MRMFRGPSSFASDLVTASDRCHLRGAINRPRGWCRGARYRANVNDAAAIRPEAIHRLLRAEDGAENIEIEQSVKMLFRYGFEREEFVKTRVVNSRAVPLSEAVTTHRDVRTELRRKLRLLLSFLPSLYEITQLPFRVLDGRVNIEFVAAIR
jgi:hypothetical protein